MDIKGFAVEGLACQRSGRIVVSGLSFEVRAGEALLLRGPNGSGKTTLLRTLAGFLAPASGAMKLRLPGGADLPSEEQQAHMHYIGHANAVKPRLSVIENVSFWQRYYDGRANAEIADAALEGFDLLHLADFRAAHLSQGQARRLGLARLLVAERALWLLDEPSASLDSASVRLLERAIAHHLGAGGLAIIATHGELDIPGAATLRLGGEAGPVLQ
jgi:heme exporter protein A